MSNEYDNHTHDELVAVVRGLDEALTSAESALAEAREENERLRDRIERAQERLDRDPAGNPNYLALSADLRGEIGRVGGVPQYDSAALRRADDAALQGVGARDEGRVERAAKWMRLEEFGEGWEELDDGEQEAWRRKARAVLAAADGKKEG